MIGVLDVRYCLLVNLYLAYSPSLSDRNQAVFQDLEHSVFHGRAENIIDLTISQSD